MNCELVEFIWASGIGSPTGLLAKNVKCTPCYRNYFNLINTL